MPSALITGASGFVGPYLARHLRELGVAVVGTSLTGEAHPDFTAIRLDVRDRSQVMAVIGELAPDDIYHLAAISQPTLPDAHDYYDVNLYGTLHVLEGARTARSRVLVVSSAYVYGAANGAVSEDTPLRPMNAYGASKAAAEMAAVASASAGQHIVRVRPFNHTGPGQPPTFFVPTLVAQLTAIRSGAAEPVLRLGNLDTVRDLSDVRDVVRDYAMLLRQGASGDVYNVGSGVGRTMREVVDTAVGLMDVDVRVTTDPARVRSNDLPHLVADIRRLHDTIDHRHTFGLESTLRDMLATRAKREP